MTFKTRSIAVRLAIMFGLAVSIASIIAGLMLFAFQDKQLQQHKRSELEGRFIIVERMTMHNGDPSRWYRFTEKLVDFTPIDQSLQFIVEGPDPRFRFNENILEAVERTGSGEGFGTACINDIWFLTLTRRVPAVGERPDVFLTIAISQEDVKQTRAMLSWGIVGMSLISILVASGLGWAIARHGLAPVGRLSTFARTLGEDLSLRLPSDRLPSELEGLVLSLNEALERLQLSYTQLSSFNADVAHELRTPISNLIGETQVVLKRDRSAEDFKAILHSNLEELERLRTIINSMLFLARADQGDVADNLEKVSLAAQAQTCVDFMDILFEDAGSAVVITGDATTYVQKSLVRQAITNLLDNALNHGSSGGGVEIIISRTIDTATVSVRSEGMHIPIDQLERLFDRFYRPDPARSGSRTNHGLGLSIVRAIAHMHKGKVFARNITLNQREGLEIGFSLPLPPDEITTPPEPERPRA